MMMMGRKRTNKKNRNRMISHHWTGETLAAARTKFCCLSNDLIRDRTGSFAIEGLNNDSIASVPFEVSDQDVEIVF